MLTCNDGWNVIDAGHDDIDVAQPIHDGGDLPTAVLFSSREVLDRPLRFVELGRPELLVVVHREPPRTPHQIVDLAVHSITIEIDRAIVDETLSWDERLSY